MTLVTISFFLFFLFASLSILLLFFEHKHSSTRKIDRRLAAYAAELGMPAEQLPYVLRDERLSDISLFDRVLHRVNFSKKIQTLLDQTDSSLTVSVFLLLSLILAILGIIFMAHSENYLLRWIVVLVLGLLPLMYIYFLRNRRLRAFIRAFPDAIDMMTSSLKAGHALIKALQMVAMEAPDPIGIEFRKTFEENNLGLPLRDALIHLTQRVNSVDLKLFVTAVLLQRETGGNLAEIFEKISYTIRERFKLMGQIRTYTAQGRMSMWILGTLPLLMMALIQVINPNYFAPLLEDKSGRLLLMIGFGMQVLGFLIIRRIIHIKFQ